MLLGADWSNDSIIYKIHNDELLLKNLSFLTNFSNKKIFKWSLASASRTRKEHPWFPNKSNYNIWSPMFSSGIKRIRFFLSSEVIWRNFLFWNTCQKKKGGVGVGIGKNPAPPHLADPHNWLSCIKTPYSHCRQALSTCFEYGLNLDDLLKSSKLNYSEMLQLPLIWAYAGRHH